MHHFVRIFQNVFTGRAKDVSEQKCGRSQLNKDLNGKKVGSDLPFDCDLITQYTVHHMIYIIDAPLIPIQHRIEIKC